MWIRYYGNTSNHHKTVDASARLGVSRMHIVGHLIGLWGWVAEYAPDGDISDFPNSIIAHAAMWDGDADMFVEALINCGPKGRPGFIERLEDGTMKLHDWEEHQPQLFGAWARSERARMAAQARWGKREA